MRAPPPAAARTGRGRDGFTLLEVLVATVILGIVILSAQASITAFMVRDVGWQEQRAQATQIAMDRVHAIQSDAVYATLAARYTESATALEGGFTRATRLSATRFSDGTEYLTVTVSVSAPRLPAPVTRTTAIASP